MLLPLCNKVSVGDMYGVTISTDGDFLKGRLYCVTSAVAVRFFCMLHSNRRSVYGLLIVCWLLMYNPTFLGKK